MAQITNLIGQTFGIYQVLSYDEEQSKKTGRVYWICKCEKCGIKRSVRADNLKRLPKSCPSCKYPNLIGKTFGELTVLEKGKTDKNGHVFWICQCSCGNLTEVAGTNLIQGYTTSCGCVHKAITAALNFEDLTGQVFGKLTVIAQSQNKNNRVMWHCKCACGTEVDVAANNLKSGHTLSCGCIHSKGEMILRQILNHMHITYLVEYTFSDLPKRRFDFALIQNNQIIALIEFHGKQHYTYIQTWHQTEEEFYQAQQRDKEKEEYCIQHGIPLLIIPYWELDNINKDWLLNKLQEICKIDLAAEPDMEEAQDIIEEEEE